MTPRGERLAAVLLSVVATYLFFLEYLPPLRLVHFFGDIEGFHFPLLAYAFRALSHGRIPEWDPTIYSGMSFVGNPQVALFYPPNWFMYAANLHRKGLAYMSVNAIVAFHIWVAFLLCWLWLRDRRLSALASALGASTFAYTGYVFNEVQHLGVVCGYAWMPLGLWGIDQAARDGSYRPLWKLAVASALAFLAGYTPHWFAFVTCAMAYAAAVSWRRLPVVAGAIAFSILLAAVQFFPTMESARLMEKGRAYGNGVPPIGPNFLLPNYYQQGHTAPAGVPDEHYLYLGAPVLLALPWMIARRKTAWPAIALLAACAIIMLNPLRIIEWIADRTPYISEICRQWNYTAAIPLAVAMLSATALDDFLRLPARAPAWLRWAVPAAAVAWGIRQFVVWLPGGAEFLAGWPSLIELAPTLGILAAALYALRGSPSGRWRMILSAAACLTVWVDCKVYSTNRRFSAVDGNVDRMSAGDARVGGPIYVGVDPAVYNEVLNHPARRIALVDGPDGVDLRFYRFTTPQGFDPLLTTQYKRAVEEFKPFLTNRLFEFDLSNDEMLRRFGVGYVMSRKDSDRDKQLFTDPRFHLLEPADSFSRIYEYKNGLPAYRWEAGQALLDAWLPERRAFSVRSDSGGQFVLIEQLFAGWRAFVDDAEIPIARWGGAFQSIEVGAGEHRVVFEYRSVGMRWGAVVSIVALLLLVVYCREVKS